LFRDFDLTRGTSKELLAFAPSYDSDLGASDSVRNIRLGRFRNQVTALQWNQQEVEQISKHLGGVTLVGNLASEEAFKAEAPDHDIIHLAMHALIDDVHPMNSKLVFSQNEDGPEDGYLHAYELYNMNLPAQLTVLSACQTGYGKLARGGRHHELGQGLFLCRLPKCGNESLGGER